MIHGGLRVIIGVFALAVGLAGIWLVFSIGGSRTLYAMALAAPLGVGMIIWGLIEVTFKLGYGLFGESRTDLHPMGTIADSMLFVATADGKLTDAESRVILHVLNDIHACAIQEKRLRQRSRQFVGRKNRETFGHQIAGAYRLDDTILRDLGAALAEVLRAEGGRPDPRAAAAALAVMSAVRAVPTTAALVSDAVHGASH